MVRDELSDLFSHFNPFDSVGRHSQSARGRLEMVETNVPKVRLPGHFRWTARGLEPDTRGSDDRHGCGMNDPWRDRRLARRSANRVPCTSAERSGTVAYLPERR
jgi:hypothetical protein